MSNLEMTTADELDPARAEARTASDAAEPTRDSASEAESESARTDLDLGSAKVSYQYCHETRLGYAEAYLTLGVKQLDKEALAEARTHFRRALEIKPQLIEAHNGLGITWACEGKLAEAHSCFFMAAEIRSDDARGLSNLGNIELALGMGESALERQRRAAELAPESPEILNNHGVALAANQHWDAAIAALERAAQFAGGDHAPVENLAMILEVRGRETEATYWRGRSAERNGPPRELRALFTASGQWLARIDRSQEAGAPTTSRSHSTESAETHIHLGNALSLQGKDEAAANAFRRALRLDPNNFEAHYGLAVALQALNQYDEARESYRRAAELRPNSGLDGLRSHFRNRVQTPPPSPVQPSNQAQAQTLSLAPHPHPQLPPSPQPPTPPQPQASPSPSPSPAPDPAPTPATDWGLESRAPLRSRDKGGKPKSASASADEDQLRAAVARTFGADALQFLDDEETSDESLRRFLQVEAAQSDPQDLERLGGTTPAKVRLEKPAAPTSPPHAFGFSPTPSALLPAARTDGRALLELVAAIDREVEAAASARARSVRLKKKEAFQSLTQRRLVFSLAEFDFAMPMANVMEIQRPPRITSLPCLPDWLLGAASLRGDVIAVVDLRAFLKLDTIDIEQSGRILYARSPDQELTLGLVVDRVQGIAALAPEHIDRDREFPDARIAPFVEGIIERPGGRPVAALSLEILLTSPEMRQFRSGEPY